MLQTKIKWKCSGASVIGNSHEASGMECQDAWAKYIFKDILAVCVCDGAGSAKFSQVGSQKIASFVAEWLAIFFNRGALNDPKDFSKIVRDTIRDKILAPTAKELSCDLRELACTLVAVACDSNGRWMYLHLGDGGIIVQFDTELQVLSTPQKGEYANETYFMTDVNALEHLKFCVSSEETQNITGFAVFTDGLEMLLYNHKTLEVAQAVTNLQGSVCRLGAARRGEKGDRNSLFFKALPTIGFVETT